MSADNGEPGPPPANTNADKLYGDGNINRSNHGDTRL